MRKEGTIHCNTRKIKELQERSSDLEKVDEVVDVELFDRLDTLGTSQNVFSELEFLFLNVTDTLFDGFLADEPEFENKPVKQSNH